jgi:hypothetical protein
MIEDQVRKTEAEIVEIEKGKEAAVGKDQNQEKDIIIINTRQNK